MGHQKIYRVTVRLDTEHDTDLIDWLKGLVPGSRSGLIRTIWRAGLKQINGPDWVPVDIEDMRRVMAEELNRALGGKQLANQPDSVQPASSEDMETKYGAKLDKMLGGLTRSHTDKDDELNA